MQGLNWQTVQVPLVAGSNQKSDPRALQAPELTICKNVRFDELGGLQTRHAYDGDALEDIFGGGTVSDARRLVSNGDELLLFTKDTLYSWDDQQRKWVERGTHLATKVSEQPQFVSTGDQIDGDRAEMDGTVIYVWTELLGSSSKGYVAAVDKTTGSVLMAPTAVSGGAQRLRLTALSTKILLSFYDGLNGLYCFALDPASPATALAGSSTTLTNTNFGEVYDITRVIGADQAVFACRRSPTTSYLVGTVTAALSVTTSTKARTCDGPIAVSCTPDGTQVQVVRTFSTSIHGDLVELSDLSDTFTAQAIGTALNTCQQIAAAHRSVQDSGEYRCYVYWSDNELVAGGDSSVKANWVDTDNNIGSSAIDIQHLAIASRAFDHDGQVYCWLVFAEESAFTGAATPGFRSALQNTYFLYRDDLFLVAKAAASRAGGFASSTGRLPSVQNIDTNTYAWCGTERRIIPIGSNRFAYADRGPREVRVEFDSDEARRCVRLGQTLYITGGEILQYDGQGLTEVGFHIYPWYFEGTEDSAGSNIPDGTYAYKTTWRWDNARGDLDRSTTATVGDVPIASGPSEVDFTILPLYVTHKQGTRQAAAVEVWRTKVNPLDDSPFYLATSKNPADTGDNGYVANDTTSTGLSFTDDAADDDIEDNEENPENGGYIESIAPPPATIIAASATRLFLAGIAGDPDRVWYSKQRDDGEVAAFNNALVVPVPPGGGEMTGLAWFQETLVAFRESAIYALPGDGYDNTGGGQNYGPARVIATEVGALNHESICVTERGIAFHSSKGKYLLNRGWQLEYIGAGVCDYDTETPLAAHVVESQHQVRWLTGSRMLVLDTLASDAYGRPTWSEWDVADALGATMWRGGHVYLDADGAHTQLTTWSNVTDLTLGIDVETAWIKLNDLQGFGRIRRIMLLGEYRSACEIRIRLARDYQATYFQDKTFTPAATAGEPLQFQHGPKIQQMQAIKVRITVTPLLAEEGSSESVKLTGIGLEVGIKPGLFPNLSAASRQ